MEQYDTKAKVGADSDKATFNGDSFEVERNAFKQAVVSAGVLFDSKLMEQMAGYEKTAQNQVGTSQKEAENEDLKFEV
jgi:hypothetical protein